LTPVELSALALRQSPAALVAIRRWRQRSPGKEMARK
jgi:hypothetical protein